MCTFFIPASGLRLHHLMQSYLVHQTGVAWKDTEFVKKFQSLVQNRMKRYGSFDYDVDAEIEKYMVSRLIQA
jgi:hypothetical protein